MKYFIGKIHERNGEYEYDHIRLYKRESQSEAQMSHDEAAKNWYDDESTTEFEEGKGEWWQNGEILTSSDNVEEIHKSDYDILTRFY